jgi:hypothetical protein
MDHFGTPSGEGPVLGPVEVALDASESAASPHPTLSA